MIIFIYIVTVIFPNVTKIAKSNYLAFSFLCMKRFSDERTFRIFRIFSFCIVKRMFKAIKDEVALLFLPRLPLEQLFLAVYVVYRIIIG